MSVQSELDRIKKNVNDTLKTISDTGVTVGTGSDSLTAAAAALANEKQNKLTGANGQFVGFGTGGNAEAKNVTASDVAFTDGDTFQQKYDSGQLTGPKGEAGTPGTQGPAGATGPAGTPGKDATINGVNALTINATGGLNGSQSGGTYTLDGSALRPKSTLVTLPLSAWSNNTQTVTVPGVLADESKQLIQPMPTIADQAVYSAAGISCTGQAANKLTFKAQTVPTEDVQVYVVIQEVGG